MSLAAMSVGAKRRDIRLHLAPMEGVVDWPLRDLMTRIGGVDRCVTEFIRVTDQRLPKKVFYSYAPELREGSRTRSGVPVFVQLLGGNVEAMAQNAAYVCELGARGIDLNFGCPAKLVNRNDGGAVLLKSPTRIFDIVKAVRQAIPESIPLTVKMRLGYETPTLCIENAMAAEEAGAEKLIVHCRTKTDGYKPPAFWEWIPKIKEQVRLPVVPNGEIWSLADFVRCHEICGCEEYMIGRGALVHPFIFREIKDFLKNSDAVDLQSFSGGFKWDQVREHLVPFFDLNECFRSNYYAQAKLKQWLRWMSMQSPEARKEFERLKFIHDPVTFRAELQRSNDPLFF